MIDLTQTVEATCAIVVARNRLHALADAEHEHDDERSKRIGNATCSHRIVASIAEQLIVEHSHNTRTSHIHRERTDTNGKDIAEDAELRLPSMSAEPYERLLADKVRERQKRRDSHRDGGSPCGACNAHIENTDEKGVEGNIDD